MHGQVILVGGQGRIVGKFGSNIGMAAKKLSKAGEFPTVPIVCINVNSIASLPVIAILISHESTRIRTERLGDLRM